MHSPRTITIAVLVLAPAVLAACGSSSTSSSTPAATTAATAASAASTSGAGSAVSLAGVCPATITVQQDWEPEAEHSGLYQLLGTGYTADKSKKRVTGPLTVHGQDTGVKLQIRAGGAAIGFQAITAQMYVDKSITLGAVSTDGAISGSASQPVTAVVSTLTKSPQVLTWDPKSHPDWKTTADIGRSGKPVVVSKGAVFADFLVGKGLLQAKQIDQGFTGAPARFLADPTIAQQGFATESPYEYEHEIPQWGKPIAERLLADDGYSVYPEALSVRTGELASLTPCLKKLVPILQQAQIDYLKNPAPTNKLITGLVTTYNDGWVYSSGVADFAAQQMKSLGIIADDSSGSFGGMDMARVQRTIDELSPILAKGGGSLKPGLKASDIATDAFIDTSIHLS